MNIWDRLMCILGRAKVDDDFLASAPPIPEGMECPDTQPTTPGALDSDLGRLE